jgi:hypothetical protein
MREKPIDEPEWIRPSEVLGRHRVLRRSFRHDQVTP